MLRKIGRRPEPVNVAFTAPMLPQRGFELPPALAGMVARARGSFSSDGERTCLSEGISPRAGRWTVLAELRRI
jgi:hypothetical protein